MEKMVLLIKNGVEYWDDVMETEPENKQNFFTNVFNYLGGNKKIKNKTCIN